MLFGRDEELSQLNDAYARALQGSGSIVLVVGEPGIGKTALCRRFALDVAEAGGTALFGHCYEEGALAYPYVAFVEAIEALARDLDDGELRQDLGSQGSILARIVPLLRGRAGIGAPDRDEGDRRELVRAVAELFQNASRRRPLAVVLEDLHWADQDTLDLLLHLSRNLEGSRLLIVGTYRDVEVARTHPFAAALAELRRQGQVGRIRLRGLDRVDVRAMLAALSGAEVDPASAGSIHEQTEGNPLFVREIERFFEEQGISLETREASLSDLGIPEGLRDVIGSRLTKLGPECNQVLAVAAVIGRDFDFESLAACADLPEDAVLDALESATAAGIVEEGERPPGSIARYRFSHALFQETLYEELSAPRRGRLHQRIARSIEERNQSNLDRHAGELTEHFARGSGPEDMAKAVHYGRVAARQAMSVFAYGEAQRLIERAIEVQEALDPADDATACDLLLQLGDVLVAGGVRSRVLEDVAPRVLALARRLDDSRRAFAACRLALAFAHSRSEEGYYWSEIAKQCVGDDAAGRILLNRYLATRAQHTGEFQTCYRLLVEALDIARATGDLDPQLFLVSFLLRFGFLTPEEETSYLDEYWSRSMEGVAAASVATFYLDATAISLLWGDRPRAEIKRQALASLAARTQNFHILDDAAWAESMFAMLDGRLEDAMRSVAASAEAERGTVPHVWRARLLAWVGDIAMIDEEIAWNADIPSYFAPAYKALFLALRGRHDEALAVLHEATPSFVLNAKQELYSRNIPAIFMEAAVTVGDPVSVEQLLPFVIDDPRGLVWPSLVFNHRPVAAALHLVGRVEEARSRYLEAIAFCESINYRPERALSQLGLADLLLRHFPSERSEALACLDSAAAEFEALGMGPHLERAASLRASETAGQVSRRPVFPDGLSEREVEVLRLVAAGKTNQQIADELFISLNTVLRHVSSIFNKTGAANRTEAANYAHSHGLS